MSLFQISWDLADLIRGIDRAKKTIDEIIREQINEAAINIQRDAKKACPVDTGRLRSSIIFTLYSSLDGYEAGEVGTDVEYAVFQEYGTRYIAPVRFLTSAYLKEEAALQGRLATAIRAAGLA